MNNHCLFGILFLTAALPFQPTLGDYDDVQEAAHIMSTGSCAPCTCSKGKSSCPVAGSHCRCMRGRLILPNGGCAPENEPTCAFFNSAWEEKHRCANCRCPGRSRRCFPYGGDCWCVDGTLYYPNGTCAFSTMEGCPKEDEKLNVDKDGCHKCRCEHDESFCTQRGSRCTCIRNVLHNPDGTCTRGRGDHCLDDSSLPGIDEPGYSQCAKCECPMDEKFCKVLGSRCDCVGGVLLLPGHTVLCARNESECNRH